jgi:2-methylfumaryl-CoA isomerase
VYAVLSDLRVIEGSSFVASPLGGMYLAQLGAEVIRFDMIGGGPDHRRWPLAPNGKSLYWEGLNKGKKSIAIDLSRPAGRELAAQLVTAPDPQGGVFLTNYPVDGFLSHERLSALRPDLITVRVMGHADGSTALDYTVNCAVGIPFLTGPRELEDAPVNHVLPAWDLLTGAYAAFALLAAERFRRITGKGQEVRAALSDIAVSTVANLGQFAEVVATGQDRPRLGNDIFGAFGRDFRTADDRSIMIVALTPRHWKGLIAALDLRAAITEIEQKEQVSFAHDEGLRFVHRHALLPLIAAAVRGRALADLASAFDENDVCWGPYQTVSEALLDARLVRNNPIFSVLSQPSGVSYPSPGAAASFGGLGREVPVRAPRLGEHTDEVLAERLKLDSGAIGRLHDQGLVAAA